MLFPIVFFFNFCSKLTIDVLEEHKVTLHKHVETRCGRAGKYSVVPTKRKVVKVMVKLLREEIIPSRSANSFSNH